jgi:phenylacetate-CoA ligase
MNRLKKLYASSPVWLQNVMVSGQGLLYAYRRWDVRLGRKLLAELRESQWWTNEQFAEFQNARLREHVQYAATRFPYYANLFKKEGIDPTIIHSVEDLRKIPWLEKEDVRKHPDQFLKDGNPRPSWNKGFTSGTTGTPLRVYTSRDSFTRVWSFVFRLREWAGLSDPIFPRSIHFTGRDIVPNEIMDRNGIFWRRNVPGRSLLMSTSHVAVETVHAYAEAIRRFNPELIDGYPSAIQLVGRVAKQQGLELTSPKVIIGTAETLFDRARHDIETAYDCRIFNQYASSDSSVFISECEHGSLHVNPEFGICEIVDSRGDPVGPGEEGEIIATSFCNREQVFIRYKIGDLVVRGPEALCPCGRAMPRVESITGRVDDLVFVKARGYVRAWNKVFEGLEGIWETQIVQDSLDLIKVNVVPNSGYDESVESALISNIRRKVGQEIAVVVNKKDRIPRDANGKFRAVVCRCKDDIPIQMT